MCDWEGTTGHILVQGTGFSRRPVYISAIM